MAVAGWGDAVENSILDHFFGKATWTPPSTIYVAVSTTDPDDDGSGITEPTGNGYARVATTATDWNSASGGATSNANAIMFPEASGSWGTITHFAFYSQSTGGTFQGGGALTASKAVGANEILRFAAGELDVTQG